MSQWWMTVDFSEDRVDAEDRNETVDFEDIDKANKEESLAEAQFDDAFSEATSKRESPVTDSLL